MITKTAAPSSVRMAHAPAQMANGSAVVRRQGLSLVIIALLLQHDSHPYHDAFTGL